MILERFVVGMMQTNCYLLGDPATRQAAVIDPGGEGQRVARRLRELDLELAMILNTHAHFDHVLDAWLLKQEMGGDVYLHPDDQVILEDRSVGLVAPLASTSKSPRGAVDQWLHEGDRLPIGSLQLEVLETPGHTPGHLCLYEKQTRIFFSGDHILDDITPNISVWSERQDPLSQYLKSLDKIVPYEIDWVLPGHRTPFQNHRRRIAELKEHHEIRTEEVASILRRGSRTAYQVASEMTWDIDCESWEDFPLPQKWFAGGEAMAHLKFLQGLGRVIREQKGGRYFFRLAEQR